MTPARRVKQLAEAAGFGLVLALVRVLPYSAAVGLGTALGRFTFAVGLRRGVAIRNVEERLAPAGGRAEAMRIARESYAVAGRTFIHLLRADRIGDPLLWRLVSRQEIDAVHQFRGGRGSLLVSGHFGNWELMVLAIRRAGIPVAALAGDQANRFVNASLRDIRARAGIRPLSSRSGIRDAMELLRGGGCVATLMDQDARWKGLFVNFLGAPASAHVGMISLAMRTGSWLVPGVLVDEKGRYRFERGEPWEPRADLSEEENLEAGAEHIHRFLEVHVRRNPENYFWAHRRWKTRPAAPAKDAPAERTAPELPAPETSARAPR